MIAGDAGSIASGPNHICAFALAQMEAFLESVDPDYKSLAPKLEKDFRSTIELAKLTDGDAKTFDIPLVAVRRIRDAARGVRVESLCTLALHNCPCARYNQCLCACAAIAGEKLLRGACATWRFTTHPVNVCSYLLHAFMCEHAQSGLH